MSQELSSRTSYFLAELRCQCCNRLVAEVGGPTTCRQGRIRLRRRFLRWPGGGWLPLAAALPRRCPRCGGALLLDEATLGRRRPDPSWLDEPVEAPAPEPVRLVPPTARSTTRPARRRAAVGRGSSHGPPAA